MLQKIYISDKYCSSELSIHQINLQKKSTQLFSTIILILINVFEQQIIILKLFLKDCMTLMVLKTQL